MVRIHQNKRRLLESTGPLAGPSSDPAGEPPRSTTFCQRTRAALGSTWERSRPLMTAATMGFSMASGIQAQGLPVQQRSPLLLVSDTDLKHPPSKSTKALVQLANELERMTRPTPEDLTDPATRFIPGATGYKFPAKGEARRAVVNALHDVPLGELPGGPKLARWVERVSGGEVRNARKLSFNEIAPYFSGRKRALFEERFRPITGSVKIELSVPTLAAAADGPAQVDRSSSHPWTPVDWRRNAAGQPRPVQTAEMTLVADRGTPATSTKAPSSRKPFKGPPPSPPFDPFGMEPRTGTVFERTDTDKRNNIKRKWKGEVTVDPKRDGFVSGKVTHTITKQHNPDLETEFKGTLSIDQSGRTEGTATGTIRRPKSGHSLDLTGKYVHDKSDRVGVELFYQKHFEIGGAKGSVGPYGSVESDPDGRNSDFRAGIRFKLTW